MIRSFPGSSCCSTGPSGELTRSEALAALRREAQRLSATHSDVTLGIHLDVFLHTYIPARAAKGGPEQALDSPLAELELLHQVGERRADGSSRREPSYAFRREPKPEVTKAVFEYCLGLTIGDATREKTRPSRFVMSPWLHSALARFSSCLRTTSEAVWTPTP